MKPREILCILHDHFLQEQHESTGTVARLKSCDIVEKIQNNLNEEENKDFEKLLDLWMELECSSNEDNSHQSRQVP